MSISSRLKAYLSFPFPRQRAFGPYASPGRIVHFPFLFLLVGVGWLLLGWHETARWLIVIYLIAGVYIGRDLAIWAHYFPPITLGIIMLFFACFTCLLSSIRGIFHWIREGAWLWPGLLVAVSLGLILALRVAVQPQYKDTDDASDEDASCDD